jgi:hypothetical protein
MSDVDNIFEQLMDIRRQMDALPADAVEERARLEHRREELHQAAAAEDQAGDERPTHEIEIELVSLRERLDKIEASGIDIVKQYGGSALEASTAADGTDLNRQLESAQGADELRARIRKLEGVLQKRAEATG